VVDACTARTPTVVTLDLLAEAMGRGRTQGCLAVVRLRGKGDAPEATEVRLLPAEQALRRIAP